MPQLGVSAYLQLGAALSAGIHSGVPGILGGGASRHEATMVTQAVCAKDCAGIVRAHVPCSIGQCMEQRRVTFEGASLHACS